MSTTALAARFSPSFDRISIGPFAWTAVGLCAMLGAASDTGVAGDFVRLAVIAIAMRLVLGIVNAATARKVEVVALSCAMALTGMLATNTVLATLEPAGSCPYVAGVA